jgi:hypothetical protein
MAPVSHPGLAGRTSQRAPARQTATAGRRAALFAPGLQLSDVPTAAMAAQAITATVRRIGVCGCVSQIAQEFGGHPDAAAERMRWTCQLAAELSALPQRAAAAGRASSRASHEIEACKRSLRSSSWTWSAGRVPRSGIAAGGPT